MSKERLEDIKTWLNRGFDLTEEDYEWLIKQAGRVQELEEENVILKATRAGNEEHIDVLHKQNKRYRGALEEIINARNHFYPTEYVFGVEGIARKALEGDSDE